MEYDAFQTKRERKSVILDQAQNFLRMVREKAECGDKESEKYWRERAIERLQDAFVGPLGWNEYGFFYYNP